MIENADIDARLEACVSQLTAAADDWQQRGLQDSPLTIAVATPRAGLVILGQGWPENVSDGGFSREAIAGALIETVEAPATDEGCSMALTAISLLVGEVGRREHLEAVTRLRGEGQIPVLIVMAADPETVTFTTSGVACSPPPDATVH